MEWNWWFESRIIREKGHTIEKYEFLYTIHEY